MAEGLTPSWHHYRRKVPTRMCVVRNYAMVQNAGIPQSDYRRADPKKEEGDVALRTSNGWSLARFPFYLATDPMGKPYPISFEAFDQTFEGLPVVKQEAER